MDRCDWKLCGGSVIDGSGSPAVRADVAVRDGRVVEVGDLRELDAANVLDCTGRVVVPGFIDLHSHADWLVPGRDAGAIVEPFVRQGMTTIVGGNCGFSPAPVTERNRAAARSASRLIVDEEVDPAWDGMDGFLSALEATGVPLNVAELVGHGAVRSAVMGALDPAVPDRDQLAAMERLARESLDAGCFGISTGLGYPPGIFSGHDELAAFAGFATAAGKLFTSHLRAYSCESPVYQTDPTSNPHNLQAIEEILDVARAAGPKTRVQISHLIFVGRRTWPTAQAAIELVERAADEGIDVGFDAFPYTAGNTTASVIFPPEMLPHLEAILGDPASLAAVRELGNSVFGRIGFFLEDVQIMCANAPAFEPYEGLFVGEAAKRAGLEIFEFYGRMVVESQRNARVLNHTYSGHDGEEDALRLVLAHPLCTIETDTFLTNRGHQNPASYGTFPRVLATYVREGLFDLPTAVHKMTGAAAARLGFRDRGLVRRGQAADLVVIDPERLRDTATFEHPARFPEGLDDVFVNGTRVLAAGSYLPGASAGRVLRA